ncbi:MAG: transposase family protein [Thermodesulfobacteriota bacterium]
MKVTTADIAAALEVSDRAIRKRASSQSWPAPVGRGKRGGNVYELESLPLSKSEARKLKGHLEARQIEKAIATAVPAPPTTTLPVTTKPAILPALDENRIQQAQHKAALLKLYRESIASAPRGTQVTARDEFVAAYNTGIPYPELFAALGRVHWKTIEGWKQRVKAYRGDILALADLRGRHLKGAEKISRAERDLLLSLVQSPVCRNTPKEELIVSTRGLAQERGIAVTVSKATYRRTLDRWIATNNDTWLFWHRGMAALEGEGLPYVERDYDLIEPGDALVADGHVLNFTITNPWTGKAQRMILVAWLDMKSMMPVGWEITPTENVKAISNALRRAIIRLGKLPKAVYFDNGRAFKAKYFTGDFMQSGEPGIYEKLGIETIVARPYKARSKTIERFFKIFGALERRCLSYVGTDVANKPAHMSRGEKLLRDLHAKITNGQSPTLEEAHVAVACWFYEYGTTAKERGRLKGVRPMEMFNSARGPGVDETALRLLMTAAKEVSIHANGVKITPHGPWFYDPALYGRKHKAMVRYDMQDQSSVLVYDQDGTLLCEALPREKVHPLAKFGTEEQREELGRQLAQVERLRSKTVGGVREFMGKNLLAEVQQQIENHEPKKAGGKSLKVKQLEARKTPEEIASEVEREEEEKRLFASRLAAEQAARLEEMSEFDRYEYWLEKEMRGEDLPAQARQFMLVFEQTAPARDLEYFESRRVVLAVLRGKKEKAAVDAAAGETNPNQEEEV